MKLSPPKTIVFLISLILVIISLLAHFNVVKIQFITQYQYWIMLVGYVLLALGVTLKGF